MFNRLFSSSKTDPVREDIDGKVQLPDRRDAFTAREALAAVIPDIAKIDTQYRLVRVVSGTDIGPDGRAVTWEFFLHFPRRDAQGNWTVAPCSEADYENPGKWCAVSHVHSIYKGISQLDAKLQSERGAMEYLRRTARQSAQRQASLPLDFYDSPKAVQALAELGADWISGDTNMNLTSKVRSDGEIVWHTSCWDKEFETPFAEHG